MFAQALGGIPEVLGLVVEWVCLSRAGTGMVSPWKMSLTKFHPNTIKA